MKGNVCRDLPAEYSGSKVGSTRTARDIFITTDEINERIKKEVDKAVEKEKEKRKHAATFWVKGFIFFLIWSVGCYILGNYY